MDELKIAMRRRVTDALNKNIKFLDEVIALAIESGAIKTADMSVKQIKLMLKY